MACLAQRRDSWGEMCIEISNERSQAGIFLLFREKKRGLFLLVFGKKISKN